MYAHMRGKKRDIIIVLFDKKKHIFEKENKTINNTILIL